MKKTNPAGRVEDSDTELVESINSGRIDRFRELVDRYQARLFNFGLRLCGDSNDAEDIVQDTFINAFQYLKGFRFETKFKNWLYRVATSSCIKKRRKSKFAPRRELSLDEFANPDAAEHQAVDPPSWASEPLDRLLGEELSEVVRNAVLELPPNYRMVLVLRDMEGFSTAEAAQILHLTESNIKVRLHRARLYLREKLKDYFDENETVS